MYSRTARVSTVRWNLKEAVSESLVRRIEIAYKARLRVISWQRTAKSNNYHVCRSRVNAADIWRERACTLSVEVSQRFHLPSNNELWEVSRTHTSEEVSVMEMEQRGEQSISLSMSRIAEEITSAVTNRVKDGQIKRDGKERTHGHK